MPECRKAGKPEKNKIMNKEISVNHLAIIMDGNGRWAKQKGMPRSYGHSAGVETVRRIASECSNMGIKYLTLYTFSTENWSRPAEEVAALMDLVLQNLEDEIFEKNNVRFMVIGDRDRIPDIIKTRMQRTIDRTANNTGMTMVLAFSYSSKWEITAAMKSIAQQVKDGTLQPEDITEETVAANLATAGIPDPDLLVRTGGECRISNYLLWQIAYSELYFTDVFWPDFNEEELHKAIDSFQKRQRRYGKTGEQVEAK